MQTGIVQPSGPSSHFWMIAGSVWARYTASGGAAKRLVTTMCVSPSVVSVNLLIEILPSWVVSWFVSSVVGWRPEPCQADRSFCRGPFAAFQAIGPSLQYRRWRGDGGAGYRQCGEQ